MKQKDKRRKFCWVRYNNQNPTLMDIDPVPPLQLTHLIFCQQNHSPPKPLVSDSPKTPGVIDTKYIQGRFSQLFILLFRLSCPCPALGVHSCPSTRGEDLSAFVSKARDAFGPRFHRLVVCTRELLFEMPWSLWDLLTGAWAQLCAKHCSPAAARAPSPAAATPRASQTEIKNPKCKIHVLPDQFKPFWQKSRLHHNTLFILRSLMSKTH